MIDSEGRLDADERPDDVDLSYPEVVLISLFYQFVLYSAIRLAHHCFTLGELGLVCFGATVLFMETINLTKAKVRTMPEHWS